MIEESTVKERWKDFIKNMKRKKFFGISILVFYKGVPFA